MGIEESNWLIRTLSKGMESNPYTPEERARMARESALRANKSNPVNEYVLGRVHMVRNHWFHMKERFGWVAQYKDPETIIRSAWNWFVKNPRGYAK